MWYPAKITTPAAAEPVTLIEAKEHCRVIERDGDGNVLPFEDDDLIERLIATARDHVERYCGVRFASQTVEIACDRFADFVRLPEAPVLSITKVAYVDTAGTTQTLDAAIYELRPDGLEPSIALKYGQQWPTVRLGSRITVTAVVGYGDVPQAVKHAMLMLIGAWYANREQVLVGVSVSDLPMSASVDALLCNHRRGI